MKKIAAISLLLLLSVLLFVSPAETKRGHTALASADLSVTKVDNRDPLTADGTFYNNMPTVSTTSTDSTPENNTAAAGTTLSCTTDPIVTTSADSGPGSLRGAIQDACVGSTITFDMTPGHVTSPITLTSELAIDKSITIQGPGANALTISGNQLVRVFNIGSVTPGISVTLSGLTIANGQVTAGDNGGGILNKITGTLLITNSVLSGNAAGGGPSRSDGKGGGIYNGSTGIVTITNSTLSGNFV